LPVHASPATVATIGTTIEILPTIDGRAEMPSE